MINQVTLVGRLTRDPELRKTNNGTPVVQFTVALNGYGDRAATTFINVIAWKDLSENVKKYVKKGHLVGLTGRLQSRSYEDKNQVKRDIVEVVADIVKFLEPKPKEDKSVETAKEDKSVEKATDDLPF